MKRVRVFSVSSSPLLPLSDPAAALLREHFPEGAKWAFATLGPWDALKKNLDRQLSQVTPWTIHDIRHTVRTLLSKVTTADTAELCMGHALQGMRKVYDHDDYTPKKRTAMTALARLIADIVN